MDDLFDYMVHLKPDLVDNSDMRKKRMKKFKNYLKKNYPDSSDGKVLLVSHGIFIMKFCQLKRCPGNAHFNTAKFKI